MLFKSNTGLKVNSLVRVVFEINVTHTCHAFYQSIKYRARYQLLTLMLLVADVVNTKWCKKSWKMAETLANGYSSESTWRELSNEYQEDRVYVIFKNLCFLVSVWPQALSIGWVNFTIPVGRPQETTLVWFWANLCLFSTVFSLVQ